MSINVGTPVVSTVVYLTGICTDSFEPGLTGTYVKNVRAHG